MSKFKKGDRVKYKTSFPEPYFGVVVSVRGVYVSVRWDGVRALDKYHEAELEISDE